jgi:DNA-3-methyladenine glycosylase I
VSAPTVLVGDDGVARCPWGASTPEYQRYHDEEWGRPVGDDNRVLEKLCLEGFQSGLSWLTILRKRDGFRRAFASFDPTEVARFDDSDVERLLQDAAIVRHRGKILATVGNARATLAMREQGISLAGVFWQHEPPRRGRSGDLADIPASTPESEALSKALRKHGFRFVGPTTVYAAMQSLGVVNDHLDGCHFRAVSESDRAGFTPPAGPVGGQ